MGKITCPFCNSKNTFNISYGYLSVEKLYPNKTASKKIEYDYNIYEEQALNPYIINQDMDNPYLASQYIENNIQQSTNKRITNRLNTKE